MLVFVLWGIVVFLYCVVLCFIVWLVGLFWLLVVLVFVQSVYFFLQGGDFDLFIFILQQFFGYEIGSCYICYDQLVVYFDELVWYLDKIKVECIGISYEGCFLLIVIVILVQNYQQLEIFCCQYVILVDLVQLLLVVGNSLVVVWLGYSVYGNEIFSGEVVLLIVYYLVVNCSVDIVQWLDWVVVLFDFVQNFDGCDCVVSWYNVYVLLLVLVDLVDKEYVELFLQGCINYYFIDFNCDWLVLIQQDMWLKIVYFYCWYFNVQIDFYEMGKDSIYYFELLSVSMYSLLILVVLYVFNRILVRYYVQVLDVLGLLYYIGENFDNFLLVYGFIYLDFYGVVGVMVEQVSLCGCVQELVNGLFMFFFIICNQVVIGLGIVCGVVIECDGLIVLQKDFFQFVLMQVGQQLVKVFVFGDVYDFGLIV